jgi:hypothetical protein
LAYQDISKYNKHTLALRTVNNNLGSANPEAHISSDMLDDVLSKKQLSYKFRKQVKDMLFEEDHVKDGNLVTIAGNKKFKLEDINSGNKTS